MPRSHGCVCCTYRRQVSEYLLVVGSFQLPLRGEAHSCLLVFISLSLQTITAGYRGAIRATANGGQWEEATSLLQRMRQDSIAVVKSEDYNAAILACVRAQQSVAALTLLGDMSLEVKSCIADETSYILVMRAFGREGR